MRVLYPGRIGIWSVVFVEGEKPENPEKNPRSKDENQKLTQPTYDAGSGNRSRATLVEGERSHHCASLLTLKTLQMSSVKKTLDKFENAPITGHFGGEPGRGNHDYRDVIVFRKSSVFKMFSFHTQTQITKPAFCKFLRFSKSSVLWKVGLNRLK